MAHAATRLEGLPAVIWRLALNEMASDLRIGPEVLRPDDFCHAYQDLLGSLVGIARRMAFASGWAPNA